LTRPVDITTETVYGFVFITASATVRPTCSQAYLLELCMGAGMWLVV